MNATGEIWKEISGRLLAFDEKVDDKDETEASRTALGKGKRLLEFEHYVQVESDPDACWQWTGPTSGGYPLYRGQFAYRLALERSGYVIPAHRQVKHLCENLLCCNPSHMVLAVCLNEQSRFWKYVDRSSGPDGCWRWIGCRTVDGHGQVKFQGRTQYAHRVVFQLATGRLLTEDDVIRHTCNNPSCCNPAHLRPGSHTDNVRDRVEAGRSATGEANGRSKLTEEQVVVMRSLHGKGRATIAELAALTGVSKRAVRFVVNGEHWREVGCVAN